MPGRRPAGELAALAASLSVILIVERTERAETDADRADQNGKANAWTFGARVGHPVDDAQAVTVSGRIGVRLGRPSTGSRSVMRLSVTWIAHSPGGTA